MEVEFGIGRNAKDGESICGLLGTRAAPVKGKGKGKGKGGGTKIHEVRPLTQKRRRGVGDIITALLGFGFFLLAAALIFLRAKKV